MAEKTKESKVVETPNDDKVTFFVPRKDKETQVMVGLNFKNYILKRGEYVTVPRGVMEVLMNSEKAEEFAESFALAKENAYLDKAANPISKR